MDLLVKQQIFAMVEQTLKVMPFCLPGVVEKKVFFLKYEHTGP